MSLIDLASLVLSPTATKEGKVYSAIPDTGDGDMTFTRGSAATRVNSAGLIEKERANLLLQSNTFDTTWIKSNATVTAGQTGYDGSSDAWLQQSTSTFCRLDQNITQTGILTLSAYAKAGTSNFLLLEVTRSGGVFYAWFDLSSGVVGTTSAIDANIESVGNGWYRCSLIGNQTLSGQVRLRVADSNGSTVTTTSSNIYIQDAMLNEGLVAQSYIPTTTSAVYEGITDDVPRVDYSGGGCPSLLLESQRTNINTQSEYFGSSNWNKARMSITDNAVTSPEGVQNAANFVEDSTSNSHPLYDSFAVSSGTSYTVSMFAKKGSRDYFRFNAATSSAIAFFNLANGTVHSGTGIIEDFGNGWYRCSMTFTATSTSEFIYIEPSINGSSANYQGDGSVSMSIYGFQLEAGSYASSYIPTYSVSSTRVADSCSKTGISELIGQTEGTMFWDLETTNTDLYKRLSLNDGTTTNWIFVGIELSTGVCRGYVKDSGTIQADMTGSTDLTGDRIKLALAYANNDFALYANGSQVATDTSGTIPSCSRIDVGSQNPASAVNSQSTTNQAILFPTRLTNDQLEELTK